MQGFQLRILKLSRERQPPMNSKNLVSAYLIITIILGVRLAHANVSAQINDNPVSCTELNGSQTSFTRSSSGIFNNTSQSQMILCPVNTPSHELSGGGSTPNSVSSSTRIYFSGGTSITCRLMGRTESGAMVFTSNQTGGTPVAGALRELSLTNFSPTPAPLGLSVQCTIPAWVTLVGITASYTQFGPSGGI